MATVIIRPINTLSQAGWDTSPMHGVLGDNDASTGGIQNSTTCNASFKLGDLDASLSGVTINSMTITLRGQAGRTGSTTCAMAYLESEAAVFGTETESFTGSTSEETTTARTTQRNGSSALTYAYINAMGVKITPATSGISAFELFVTVDYTPAGYTHDIMGVDSGDIEKVIGVATADIGKIIGVD